MGQIKKVVVHMTPNTSKNFTAVMLEIYDKYKDTDSIKASKFMFEKAKVECIRLKPRTDKIEISFKTQDQE